MVLVVAAAAAAGQPRPRPGTGPGWAESSRPRQKPPVVCGDRQRRALVGDGFIYLLLASTNDAVEVRPVWPATYAFGLRSWSIAVW